MKRMLVLLFAVTGLLVAVSPASAATAWKGVVVAKESIAYAVPGFASTAATPAAAAAVGIPLIAKLAAAGAAVGIAGSAGVVAERSLHDPPARPSENTVEQVAPIAAKKTPKQAELLPVPAGGFPVVRRQGGGGDDRNKGAGDSSGPGSVAGNNDDGGEAQHEDASDNSGPGNQADTRVEDDGHDNSGPGSGVDLDEPRPEPELAVPTNTDAIQPEAGNDNSGPGSGGESDRGGDDGGNRGPG